jgi:hypothetical protein
MSKRVFRRATLAMAGAAALTAATALPGSAATTASWRLSFYESSLNGQMTDVAAISKTDVWAVGNLYHGQTLVDSPHVLRWTGRTWVGVTIPGSTGYTSDEVAASSASDVWIIGSNADGASRIFRFDGTHWHTVPAPATGVDDVTPFSATDAWADGETSCTGNKCVTDIWQWNGAAWVDHPVNSSVPNISASSAGNVWAIGLGGVNAKGEGTVAAYRWAGTHWTPVVMPHPDMSGWVNAAMSSASDVWIEGWRGTSSQTLGLHWNGSKWSQVTAGDHDAASSDAEPYGSGGVWFGPWYAWTGRGWVNTVQFQTWGGAVRDFAPIPGAAGSYWGAAQAQTNSNSDVFHPAMVIYGPLP